MVSMDKVDLVYYFTTSMGYATFWTSLFTTIAKSNRRVLALIGFVIGVCLGTVLLLLPTNAYLSEIKQLITLSSIIAGIGGILIRYGIKK